MNNSIAQLHSVQKKQLSVSGKTIDLILNGMLLIAFGLLILSVTYEPTPQRATAPPKSDQQLLEVESVEAPAHPTFEQAKLLNKPEPGTDTAAQIAAEQAAAEAAKQNTSKQSTAAPKISRWYLLGR